MSVPTVALNEATPAGGDYVRGGDDRITEYKLQVREIMEVDHNFPSSGQSATAGIHKQMTLTEAADIGTGAAGLPILGAQTVGTKPELTYTDEDDDDVQITADGNLNAAALGGVYAVDNLAAVAAILEHVYPVGSIYTSIVSTNPGTLLGIGTWVAFGAGKVLVGLNSGDGDFDTAEETGGAKTVDLAHTHSVPRDGWGNTGTSVAGRLITQGGAAQLALIDNTSGSGGSATQSVVQPYIVVYMWKRTV